MKKIIPTEYEECVTLVTYLEMKGYLFSHLAQSTYSTSWNVKRKNHNLGVRKGVPDYMIVVPNAGLVFIEMKREKGGVISPEQQEWIAQLSSIPHVEAKICKGVTEAIMFLETLNQ